jgi:dTDP-4-dehydrorhamnose reductase
VKVFVAGAGGMVGRAVSRHCETRGDEVVAADHKALDIGDRDRVIGALTESTPDVVINCAAWTDVDGCEGDSARAYAANATGPENLAWASRLVGSGLITISTDYVFDGAKTGFYTQRDDPNPQSVYAAAKLEGERRAQNTYARTIVVRSGFIFGPGGKNFLSAVMQKVQQNEPIKAISDSFGTPTYALDLAQRLRDLAEMDLPGIFHIVNAGDGASYEEFARAAVKATGQNAVIDAVTDASLHRPAVRPKNSRLRCLYSEALGLSPLRSWQEALTHFIQIQRVS